MSRRKSRVAATLSPGNNVLPPAKRRPRTKILAIVIPTCLIGLLGNLNLPVWILRFHCQHRQDYVKRQ
jgi:hypothetical protein